MDLAPPEAWIRVGKDLIKKNIEEITLGEIIIVKPGDKIPLDGEIIIPRKENYSRKLFLNLILTSQQYRVRLLEKTHYKNAFNARIFMINRYLKSPQRKLVK